MPNLDLAAGGKPPTFSKKILSMAQEMLFQTQLLFFCGMNFWFFPMKSNQFSENPVLLLGDKPPAALQPNHWSGVLPGGFPF